jgi:hypothetical protein
MVKEGLGYSLRNYDPCLNFNADRFSCSDRNVQLYRNIAMSRAPEQAQLQQMASSVNYTAPRNYNPQDSYAPLPLRTAGLRLDTPYNFPSLEQSYVISSRSPCSIFFNRFPCKRV